MAHSLARANLGLTNPALSEPPQVSRTPKSVLDGLCFFGFSSLNQLWFFFFMVFEMWVARI